MKTKKEQVSTSSGETIEDEFSISSSESTLTKDGDENQAKPILEKPKLKVKKIKVAHADAERFSPTIEQGLNDSQVESRIIDGLTNEVNTKYSKSILSIILSNTCTFFNLLYLIVFIAYTFTGVSIGNYLFVLVVTPNILFSIILEINAKRSVEKLSILQSPTTKVIRNGEEVEIPSSMVVLDDIFKVTTGNQIPVDGIIMSGYVEINESLLTGESVAVKKTVGDFIMAGSFITSGTCVAIADKVGEECYVQKLTAKAKKYKKPHSELMSSIMWVVKIVGILIIPMAFGIGLVNFNQAPSDQPIMKFVVESTGPVILGMIPAGLILLTTIAFALGVIRLAWNKTLVQDMYSLEMLARVDVLCLDKTGTITDGRMKVVETIQLCEHPYSLTDVIGSMEKVLEDTNQTACALRDEFITENYLTSIKALPFSSKRKLSAVTFKNIGTYAIGAPEFVLNEIPEKLKHQIDEFALRGNRVLLLAHSPSQITSKDTIPLSMKPIALIVITDNIRPEAIDTIKWFKDNNVQVKVISGDNPVTVSEIASRAGIENASNWVSLEGLSDKEVEIVANNYTVFGRVTPDQKAVLVRAMKRAGHTVAMTGDGVNDILAMKDSDCAITVASGADSAKNVAHIVLTDNNFNSLPKVVAQGRRVVNNIQQSASLYVMKNIFICLLAMISIASLSPFPFKTTHLTMLELVVLGIATTLLAIQPNNKKIEGDFLLTIISNAIPGALILLFNVYIMEFFNIYGWFGGDELLLRTVQVVSFSFGSIVYLIKICRPLNAWRTAVVLFVLIVMVFWALVLLDTRKYLGTPDNFFQLKALGLKGDSWKYPVLILCLIQLNFPLVDLLIKLNSKLIKNKDIKSITVTK